MNQEERMEEALKSRQNVFEQDVIGSLNEIKVRHVEITQLFAIHRTEIWENLLFGGPRWETKNKHKRIYFLAGRRDGWL